MLAQPRIKIGDIWYLVTDGKVFDEAAGTVKDGRFAIRADVIDFSSHKGLGTKFVQFWNLVMPGLERAQHIFKGLQRPLYNDNSAEGDKEKLVYTWRWDRDFEWERNPDDPRFGECRGRDAPAGFVFAVIVSPNIRSKEKFPGIDCFIEAWTWMAEDPGLQGAPVEWVDRYEQRLWSRSD